MHGTGWVRLRVNDRGLSVVCTSSEASIIGGRLIRAAGKDRLHLCVTIVLTLVLTWLKCVDLVNAKDLLMFLGVVIDMNILLGCG